MSIKPRANVERSNTPRKLSGVIREPQIEIATWCRDDEAKLPPEQVHFVITLPGLNTFPPLVMRFKSPYTLGFLIEELIKYRLVWPMSEKVTGEP